MSGGGRGYAIGYLEDIDVCPDIIEYLARIDATLEPYDGEWVVHGIRPEVIEGQLPGDVIIIGFPSVQAARDWYFSPAYQEILALRTDHSSSVVALLDGVPTGYRATQTAEKLAS